MNTLTPDIFRDVMVARITHKSDSLLNDTSTTKHQTIPQSRQLSQRKNEFCIDFTIWRWPWYRLSLTNDSAVNTNAPYWTERVSKFKHVPWPQYSIRCSIAPRMLYLSLSHLHINVILLERECSNLFLRQTCWLSKKWPLFYSVMVYRTLFLPLYGTK